MGAPLSLPCSYRTCSRPAVLIARADGPAGLYTAGTCDRHQDQIAARALKRTAATVVEWEPVKNPPPPPQDDAAALF